MKLSKNIDPAVLVWYLQKYQDTTFTFNRNYSFLYPKYHLRMWQGRFFAFTDVIDTFVVTIEDISPSLYALYEKHEPHFDKTFIYKLIIENMRMCFPVEMADPRMFTKRSSADLWMWNTSSLNRQRQELLWRANFHKLRAAGSLFRAAWHKMYPTRTENRETNIS